MTGTNYERLFIAVDRLPSGLPRPTIQGLDQFTTSALTSFGRTSPTRTTFVVHSGIRMARVCHSLVAELSSHVGLGTIEPWRTQWTAVGETLTKFFNEARSSPTFLWTHTVCWTDRAIRRQFLNGDINLNSQHFHFVSPDQPIELYFEGSRGIGLQANKLRWLRHEDGLTGVAKLVKIVEVRRNLQEGKLVSSGRREALGAYHDPVIDLSWLQRSMFPGLHKSVYSLCENVRGEPVGVRSLDTRTGGAYLPPATYRVIDTQGILDVMIVKGWRLRVEPGPKRTERSLVEELAFVFDRSGEVAYVAATCDKLQTYIPNGTPDDWLGQWLARMS